jgi:hypothetical protein
VHLTPLYLTLDPPSTGAQEKFNEIKYLAGVSNVTVKWKFVQKQALEGSTESVR